MRTRRLIALTLTVIAAVVVAACSPDSGPPEPTTGDWHGAVQVPGQPIEIGVTFADDGSATIDIPSGGIWSVALKDVRSDRGGVEFAIPNLPGDPVFRGRYESDRISGEFTQNGKSHPLTLERGELAGFVRPQEPKPPFPYESEDVIYRNGDITIAGTLTSPRGSGPFPAVLMITGSGEQNRDEEIDGHKFFLLIADTLTRAGYAVLRTDDRGIGGTGGRLNDANYTDLTGDAAAGVNFLRGRNDIDPARVGLFGHSEGGYLAPLVAARPDSGVAFAILMAGPSVPGDQLLIEQIRVKMAANGASPADIDKLLAENTELATFLKAGDLEGAKAFKRRSNATWPEEQRVPEDEVGAQVTPYFAARIQYDPAPALSALRIPVLAFFGGTDLEVMPAQNEQPMRDRLAGNPHATIHTFPGLNHMMQPSETGKFSEYAVIETTISPEVLTYITGWLTQRFPPK